MILPAQAIREARLVYPMHERSRHLGATYGIGPSGYDVRLAETIWLWPGRFVLASTLERFEMPTDVLGVVHDKSTWARCGIACQNTVIEPGWRGFLTLEITMHAWRFRRLPAGTPIAQIVFHRLETATERPYRGKYQDQSAGPQRARFDHQLADAADD
jgi:dCTP deaminase